MFMFSPAVAYSQARAGLSLVIVKAGQTLFQHYAPGISPKQPLAIASGTKSWAAILAVLALQDGLLTDWDQPLAQVLHEWQSHPHKSQISLRQLLSLTSGLPGGRSTLFGGTIPTYAQAIAAEPTAAPGQRFQYGPIPFQVLGAVLGRQLQAAGLSPDPGIYLAQRLFEPLQIKCPMQPEDWSRDQAGLPHLASGLRLTALDWAKMGQLLAAQGQWQGQQLLALPLLQACFQGSRVNPAYGLGFWLNATGLNVAGRPWLALPHQPEALVMALGAGNQNMYILPEQQWVIVRQGEMRLPMPDFDHAHFLGLILDAAGKR
jgi:CubicO group peptidase (beta-lactamase class C family)